ncbi:hypothetical protein [Cytobacillus purgationiresistens]|uniref:RNA polymerase-binding transcription factor DksA n=1 Tax=Cytobacillus purgationiresistens TaxID=863449 RepID=A0ABU0AFB9_9BACI|nr:hypothetical protein [Cytobacillus purgationiresistens]MDQ0269956.1 RNA polymerase-binding transcription factor DksA [Cytobacillus purgationiresistens]
MQLTEKQLKIITDVASQNAIKAYREYTEQQQQDKHDRRLRNIKLLLRNYRKFVKHCDDVEADIKNLKEKLDLADLDTDEFRIQSIMRSKKRTLAMIEYIDKALRVYESMCQESGDPEDIRRYKVVYDLYISKDKVLAKDIASRHFVHHRTIYKDIDSACKTLSVLMFGIDGVKFR